MVCARKAGVKVARAGKEEALIHACKVWVEVKHIHDRMGGWDADSHEKVEEEPHVCKKVVVGSYTGNGWEEENPVCKCREYGKEEEGICMCKRRENGKRED